MDNLCANVELDRVRWQDLQSEKWYILTNVGSKIRLIRKLRGYTISDVCMNTNILADEFSQAESGRRGLSVPELLTISQFLDVSIDYLLSK